MSQPVIKIKGSARSTFKDEVMKILPDGGNLNLCLT